MRLSTCILALTLAASAQVLAEEVTLGVWHKLSDHESFEKRGEIRFDADEWINWHQSRAQATAASSSSQASARRSQQQKQQQQQQQAKKQQEPVIVYENTPLDPAATKKTLKDYLLNVRAPIPEKNPEEEQEEEEEIERATDEDGNFTETEEEYQARVIEWKAEAEAEYAEKMAQMTPGSVAFYQIELRDEVRGWKAMSSIKSCLLVASDFQEKVTLHLDHDRQVYAFDYYTTASKCEKEHEAEYALTSLDQFKNMKVDLALSNTGAKARYTKAQTLRLDQTGQPEAEKTFFQKYWMYILPIVLVMLLGGGEPEKTAS
ncbi:MAG: hypothetical protein J3Q66DRAFT_342874 [Benniella sp.]|nr:MAG: hypothetical protein J3Q66DRAFT_342874 [Benniella sp.]